MKSDKDKWLNNIFDSAKGSQRARPSDGLFDKIEQAIDQSEAKVIVIEHWRATVAAAVVVLLLNLYSLQALTQVNQYYGHESAGQDLAVPQLISDYQIYE